MQKVFLIFCIFSFNTIFSQKPTVFHVITHNRTTVVTNPHTGEKSYKRWGNFPSEDVKIRKIILHLTLGTPDSMTTAHWDYCDNVIIRRKGGKTGKSLDYEIARMLTPYGSMYAKGWQFEWTSDVTDFSMFLRDSVEIEYRHTGYEPDSVGWALTLDFEIFAGKEVMKPYSVTQLWNGHFKYGDTTERIETKLLPIEFSNSEKGRHCRIRIQHTGHGMDMPRYCSEFCKRWRELYIDGKLIDKHEMWKDCGDNPLYPQGGTWIYDRAYWCPGDLQKPDIYDFEPEIGKHIADIKMQAYTATENIQAVENINAYMIYYSEPLAKYDIALEDIVVPSDKQIFGRKNPACFRPKIIVRNLGSENMNSFKIVYGTEGFKQKTFIWKGNLKFYQSAEIELPGEIEWNSEKNIFSVTVEKPNGKNDEWKADNSLTSAFTIPVKLPCDFVIRLKTNNHPKDNSIYIINNKYDTIYNKKAASLNENFVYSDTIHLAEGKYELMLCDTAGDGLEFWAEPDQGDGYLRLFDMKGNLIFPFVSDCGNGKLLSFTASTDYKTDTINAQYAFSLFPRKIKDKTELEVSGAKPAQMTVKVTVGGKLFEKHDYNSVKNGLFTYNLGYLPKGRIVVEVLMDGKSKFKGRVAKE